MGGRFAGERLSARFLKDERLFPYEDRAGELTLAIARPIEDETIRATEIALQREVTIAVATADDIDAALATTLESIPTKETPMAAEAAAVDDNLDDLRELARGAGRDVPMIASRFCASSSGATCDVGTSLTSCAGYLSHHFNCAYALVADARGSIKGPLENAPRTSHVFVSPAVAAVIRRASPVARSTLVTKASQ